MLGEEILYLPIRQLAERLRTRRISPVELAESYLDRSEKIGAPLNAYATLTRELAMTQARAAEQAIAAGHYRGPLHGIPYAVKDLLAVPGYPTTWGAKPYEQQRFDYNATVVDRLNRAGAVLIGKAAMIELAGGLGYSGPLASLQGPCHNPWNTAYWTCGSSSGSGAIASAALAAFALGSDTRGSIICPATMCGVAGLRPSFGRVSRYGVMALAWSMDKIGPLARSADCCGLVLEAIAGHDPKDFDSLPAAQSTFHDSTAPLGRPLRIGRLTNAFAPGGGASAVPSPVHAAADAALDVMRKQGAIVEDAQFPEGPYEEAAELVILIEAASSFSELIDSGRCSELEDPLGQINGYASRQFSAYDLLQIDRVRLVLAERMDALFDRFDVLAAPGQGNTASPLQRGTGGRAGGGAGRRGVGGATAGRGGRDGGTRPAQPDGVSSLCGLPSITVPCGFTAQNLPMGIQFMGRVLREDLCIAAARQFQQHTDWHTRRPAGIASA